MDSPAAVELLPCALGCLFNNRLFNNRKCSAERTQRNWNVALGYCDRAGRPRLTTQLGRPRSHDYRVYEEQDGSAGGPGGTRKGDSAPRACCACMERAVGLVQWMPAGPHRRRRTEVDLYLLRCAQCVPRGQVMPTYAEFEEEMQRARRQGRAAERYTEAYMEQIAANEHLAVAARECAASDVATFDLEQDLDGWRGFSALNPRKRLRSDDAEEQRRVYDSTAAFGRVADAYEALEPHGVHAQSRRQGREAAARAAAQRAARAVEQRAAREAAEQGRAARPRLSASWREAEAAAGGYAVESYTNPLDGV